MAGAEHCMVSHFQGALPVQRGFLSQVRKGSANISRTRNRKENLRVKGFIPKLYFNICWNKALWVSSTLWYQRSYTHPQVLRPQPSPPGDKAQNANAVLAEYRFHFPLLLLWPSPSLPPR